MTPLGLHPRDRSSPAKGADAEPAAEPVASPPLAARELQHVWVPLLQRPWRTIAIVPFEAGRLARSIARSGADVAHFFELTKLHLIDAHGASADDADRLRAEMLRHVDGGERVVVAIDPPGESASAMRLLVAADAALLLVRLGTTRLAAVKRVVDTVGRARVAGCVTLRGPGDE